MNINKASQYLMEQLHSYRTTGRLFILMILMDLRPVTADFHPVEFLGGLYCDSLMIILTSWFPMHIDG